MERTKNFTAKYTGDFTNFDLTVKGEVLGSGIIGPTLSQRTIESNEPNTFDVEVNHVSGTRYVTLEETFKVTSGSIETVRVFIGDEVVETIEVSGG